MTAPVDYEAVYREFAPRVRTLANRRLSGQQLGEDVVQETFWRVYRALPTIDPERPLWPWLRTIAENVCRDMLRAGVVRPEQLVSELPEGRGSRAAPGHEHEVVDLVLARARAECIADALEAVNPRQRQALLHMVQGTSAEEVARHQGATVNATKAAVRRARETFREVYLSLAAERGLLGSITLAPVRWVRDGVARARRAAADVNRFLESSGMLKVLPVALGAAAAAVAGALAGMAGGGAGHRPALASATPGALTGAVLRGSVGVTAPGGVRARVSVPLGPLMSSPGSPPRPAPDDLPFGTARVSTGIDHSKPNKPLVITVIVAMPVGGPVEAESSNDMACDGTVYRASCDVYEMAPNPGTVQTPGLPGPHPG